MSAFLEKLKDKIVAVVHDRMKHRGYDITVRDVRLSLSPHQYRVYEFSLSYEWIGEQWCALVAVDLKENSNAVIDVAWRVSETVIGGHEKAVLKHIDRSAKKMSSLLDAKDKLHENCFDDWMTPEQYKIRERMAEENARANIEGLKARAKRHGQKIFGQPQEYWQRKEEEAWDSLKGCNAEYDEENARAKRAVAREIDKADARADEHYRLRAERGERAVEDPVHRRYRERRRLQARLDDEAITKIAAKKAEKWDKRKAWLRAKTIDRPAGSFLTPRNPVLNFLHHAKRAVKWAIPGAIMMALLQMIF